MTQLRLSLLLFAVACGPLPRPECLDNDTCDLQVGGACVLAPTGHKWCQYPSDLSSCPSGYTWSPEAGDGLARSCVGLVDGGGIDTPDASVDAPLDVPDAAAPDSADITTPDAAPPDASPPDATEPDADPSGPLSLTVFDKAQAPLPGARVFSHDAEGRWLASASTDAAGRATMRIPPGGAITVATMVQGTRLLTTVFDVEPGDDLDIIDAEGEVPFRGPQIGEAHIKLPGTRSGAATYAAGSNCTFNGDVLNVSSAVVQPVHQFCSDGGPVDAIGTALNATPVNIAFSAGSAPLSSGVATINLPQWVSASEVDVTLLNSAVSLASMEAEAALVNGGRAAVTVYCTLPNTSTLRCPLPVTPSPSLVLRTFITVFTPSGAYRNERDLLTDVPLPAAGSTIDLAQIPPVLGGLIVDLASAARPRVRWSAAGSLDDLDGGFVILEWKDAAASDHVWMFIVPPGLSLIAPELPADAVADWAPNVPAADINMALMALGQASGNVSYSQVRQNFPEYLRLGLRGKFVRVTTLD